MSPKKAAPAAGRGPTAAAVKGKGGQKAKAAEQAGPSQPPTQQQPPQQQPQQPSLPPPPPLSPGSAAEQQLLLLIRQRQQEHRESTETHVMAQREERARLRALRREAITHVQVAPRDTVPFAAAIPTYVPSSALGQTEALAAAPAAAAVAVALAAKGGSKGGKGVKSTKGGKAKSGKGAKGAPAKKESTKLMALQYKRTGEKPKGIKRWIKDLESRGWSKKKTVLAAGMEAWLEAYAEAYAAKRLARQIAPFAFKRKAQLTRDAARIWWEYWKQLAAKGTVSAGAAARMLQGERASMLFRRWRRTAEFQKALPAILRRLPYGRLLQHGLREWKEGIERSTPRRKAREKQVLLRASEHHRKHVALPHAMLVWCDECHGQRRRQRAAANIGQMRARTGLYEWHHLASERRKALAPVRAAAHRLLGMRMRNQFHWWSSVMRQGIHVKSAAEGTRHLRLLRWTHAWRSVAISVRLAKWSAKHSRARQRRRALRAFIAHRERQLRLRQVSDHTARRLQRRLPFRRWSSLAYGRAVLIRAAEYVRICRRAEKGCFARWWHRTEARRMLQRATEYWLPLLGPWRQWETTVAHGLKVCSNLNEANHLFDVPYARVWHAVACLEL